MTQSEHLGDRSHTRYIAIIPGVRTFGHAGASRWFNRNELNFLAFYLISA